MGKEEGAEHDMNGYSYDFRAMEFDESNLSLGSRRMGDPVSVSLDLPWYLWVTFVVAPAALIGYGIYRATVK